MITLTRITLDDFVPDVFLNIINNNFSTLQDNMNSVTDIINISDKKIQGIEELSITKAGVGDITDVLFTTNGSGRFGGNLTVRQLTETGSLTAQSNVVIESGILDVKNINSTSTIRGSLKVDKEFVLGSAANAPVAMQFTTATKITGVIGFPTFTIGKLDARGQSFMMLDFRGRNASNTNDFLNLVRLDTVGVKTGHVLDVFVLLPATPIPLDTFKIANGKITADGAPSIANIPVDAAIQFTGDYQGASFIFNGTSWILKSFYNGAFTNFINV